jgi:hypothetical protein
MEFFNARAAQIAWQSRDPARCMHLMRSKVEAFVQSGNNNLSGGGVSNRSQLRYVAHLFPLWSLPP